MTLFYEPVIMTVCCDEPEPLSAAVLTVWSIGGEIYGTYRHKDNDDCVGREVEHVAKLAQPLLKRLES